MKVLKRFAMQSMRNFGVGKKSLEEKIQVEAIALTKEIEKQNGQPHCPNVCTQMAVTNIICSIIFRDRLFLFLVVTYTLQLIIPHRFVADSSMAIGISASLLSPWTNSPSPQDLPACATFSVFSDTFLCLEVYVQVK